MFGFGKTKDIITLFHKSTSPASVKLATILKQASAAATASATEDEASAGTPQSGQNTRDEFDLNITEDSPTPDQVQTILEYVGPQKISAVIPGSKTVAEALKKFKQSPDVFKRPVVVDWNNGKALATENESEILKLVQSWRTA